MSVLKQDRLAYSVADFGEIVGVSRPMVYREINNGRLRSFKVGKRRFISRDAVKEWIRSYEEDVSRGDAA